MAATPPRRPRQARARATRQRVYEAAMAEFARAGVEQARVEDIVAAAGVSWGTFFHWFPRKQDVLLEAGAEICIAFARSIDESVASGAGVREGAAAAFGTWLRAAPADRALRAAVLAEIAAEPGVLTVHLDGRAPTLVPAMAALMAEGQRRGEIRSDEPPEALATILVYGVLGAARRARAGPPFPTGTPVFRLAQDVILAGMAPGAQPVAVPKSRPRQ